MVHHFLHSLFKLLKMESITFRPSFRQISSPISEVKHTVKLESTLLKDDKKKQYYEGTSPSQVPQNFGTQSQTKTRPSYEAMLRENMSFLLSPDSCSLLSLSKLRIQVPNILKNLSEHEVYIRRYRWAIITMRILIQIHPSLLL